MSACFKAGLLADAYSEVGAHQVDFAALSFLLGWVSYERGRTAQAFGYLGDLAGAFNDMAAKLGNAINEVRDARDSADEANAAEAELIVGGAIPGTRAARVVSSFAAAAGARGDLFRVVFRAWF